MGRISRPRLALAGGTPPGGIPPFDPTSDPTPGLALVYSRLHPHLPAAVPFAIPTITLGREHDNTLAIPEAAVSHDHARFERRDGGQIWVVDQQSMNGTFVNGMRVREQALAAHDVVRVGDTIFRFAATSIYGYGAYRIDGGVVRQARPFSHGIDKPFLVGGFQVDQILDRIASVAQSAISVLVMGEAGTGKELVARQIHRLGARKGPFQAINCAALPKDQIERELFGYRGASGGVLADKAGLVKAAHGGTLFLDDVADMPLDTQAKLLRVLHEQEILPLGGTVAERVDIRVVSATQRDLEASVARREFRGDLLARLRELSVTLPPLRARREDLYPLVLHFLRQLGHAPDVSFPFMLAVAHYDWPYNVRELENAVRVAATMSAEAPLDLAHLPDPVRRALDAHGAPAPGTDTDSAVATPDDMTATRTSPPSEQELRELLVRHRGDTAAVGAELGQQLMRVHRWAKLYGLDPRTFRS